MQFNAYNSIEFRDVICDVYDLNILDIPELESDEHGLFFLSSNKQKRPTRGFCLPMGFYQTATHVDKTLAGEHWKALKEYSLRNKINISITTVGEVGLDHGVQVANNPILQLDGVTDPFALYKKNHRQNIKKENNKAARHSVVLDFTDKESDLIGFYNVMAKQYVKKHKMVFQPISLFQKLMKVGVGKLLVARINDKVIGGMFFILDGEVLHYNWGARQEIYNINVGTLLIDFAIRHSIGEGYKYFDFGSTPLSDAHLYKYKMKWGCENYEVYNYHTLEATDIIDLNASYVFLRNLYSFTPVPLAKAVMPTIVPWLIS